MRAEVLKVLDQALKLQGRTSQFTDETRLLGALPELDSLAMTGLLLQIEKQFQIRIEDDEIEKSIFNTVGSLSAFIGGKLQSKKQA